MCVVGGAGRGAGGIYWIVDGWTKKHNDDGGGTTGKWTARRPFLEGQDIRKQAEREGLWRKLGNSLL